VIQPAEYPPPVRPGDRVGVAALSAVVDPERLERGLGALRELGFEPVLAENLASRHGMFAGSDEERIESFHRLAADPTLGAIFFARGGHGLLRVLPHIDWELLARHPRAYVGYSDLTPFLLEVVLRLGRVALHGPMVATDLARGLDAEETASLLAALRAEPLDVPFAGLVREGHAEGVLLGGCLSLLTATLGTAHAPRLGGAILFWEDVNEPLYRIDRMLTHLGLSGTLEGVVGMVTGRSPCAAAGDGEAWQEVVRKSAGRFSGPVAWGLPSGHGSPNLTLPLGRPAVLDADALRLRVR
jgi:muramoyltetrapeptide carboxypeptidase